MRSWRIQSAGLSVIVAIAVAVVASPASLAKPKRTKRVVVTTTMTAVAKPSLEVKGIRDSTPFALLASSTSGVYVATVFDDHSSPWIAPQSVAWQEEWRSTTQRVLVVTELVEFPSLVREKPDIPVEKLNDFTRPGDSISTALTIRNHVLLWLYVSPPASLSDVKQIYRFLGEPDQNGLHPSFPVGWQRVNGGPTPRASSSVTYASGATIAAALDRFPGSPWLPGYNEVPVVVNGLPGSAAERVEAGTHEVRVRWRDAAIFYSLTSRGTVGEALTLANQVKPVSRSKFEVTVGRALFPERPPVNDDDLRAADSASAWRGEQRLWWRWTRFALTDAPTRHCLAARDYDGTAAQCFLGPANGLDYVLLDPKGIPILVGSAPSDAASLTMFDADSGEVVEKTATKPLQSSTAQTTPKRWFILHGPAKRGRLVAQAAGGDILAEVRVAGVGPLGRTSSSPPDEDSPDPFGATN